MARSPYHSAPVDRPSANGDAHLVGGTAARFRRDFTDPTLAVWDVVTGAGMTVTANGGLTIATGTTINSETSLTSKDSFTAPFRAAFGFKISQKIVNQDFFVELVAVDKSNSALLDETAVASWRISGNDSLTTTIARAEVRNGQAARAQSGNLTVGTQTTDTIYEIVLESDEVSFHNKPIDSTGGKTLSYVRNSIAPDPNREYKLRIRAVNNGTAPASTTTLTCAFVTSVDYTEILTEITGGQGRTDASGSIPVTLSGSPTVVVTSTVINASATATGTSIGKVLSAASTTPTSLKGSAGRVYGYHLSNTTAAWKYFRLYNKATAPTVGTDSPVMVVPIPPNGSATLDMTIPATFGTGIGWAITGASPDLDTTALAVGDVVGHILWV